MTNENSMMREDQYIDRTAHLLALMKKGDGPSTPATSQPWTRYITQTWSPTIK